MNADLIADSSGQQVIGRAFSRRSFITMATATAGAFCFDSRAARAAQALSVPAFREAAAGTKISVTELRGNISVLTGSGGNIAVLSGRNGKLLVDAGLAGSRRQIANALAGISDKPVKHLINTHWHFDHTDGNEWLHSEGAEITAHENTHKHLSVATRMTGWRFTFPPAPPAALPTTVFKNEHHLTFDDAPITLRYYIPAHTDSDIFVEFSDADVLHVGDTWLNGHYPFIDYSTGGNIDGTIRAAQLNIDRAGEKTVVIPGHGDVGNRAGLIDYRDMLVAIREKIATLKMQGMSLDDVIAAKPTAAHDAKWGTWLIDGKAFTALVYAGV